MLHTLTTNSTLYKINRYREHYENQIQKRKALGYCIKILLVIAIGLLCWHFSP